MKEKILKNWEDLLLSCSPVIISTRFTSYSHLQPQPFNANYIHGQLNCDVTQKLVAFRSTVVTVSQTQSSRETSWLPFTITNLRIMGNDHRQVSQLPANFLHTLKMCFNFTDTTNRFLK